MFKENWVVKFFHFVKKFVPRAVFNFFAPIYHGLLAIMGNIIYGNPSKKLKVIGVTGTKGKSTVVYMVSEILEKSGHKVAAIGSLGFRINDKRWPNNLKMTMPGRFRIPVFLKKAVDAGCEYAVLEVTSEGIKQKRHLGIDFDCAVFTNLHKEHIESHGSFENYYKAKQELFKRTKNIHVINADDSQHELFSKYPSRHRIFYGLRNGDVVGGNIKVDRRGSSFDVGSTRFNINLSGEFNVLNCLAAMAVAMSYKLELSQVKPIIEDIKFIPGRMQFIQREPFSVVVDYAHTPESLELVYMTLKCQMSNVKCQKLICVLGACGGGRDRWKRPEFGRIAAQYCDEIILTNEDPYDENPETILDEIASGFSEAQNTQPHRAIHSAGPKVQKIIDRKDAIKHALMSAHNGDVVIITGKGSELSIAIANDKKIPWSDVQVVRDLLGAK